MVLEQQLIEGKEPRLSRVINQVLNRAELVWQRLRAGVWRLRGARLGAKVTFGPSVSISQPSGVTLLDHATVESLVWLKLVHRSATVQVGKHSFIGRGTQFDVSQSVRVGDHVLIAPNVFITDHQHRIDALIPIADQGCEQHPVEIGDDVWIGTGAVILPGVTIGRGAVIGAGAVVNQDVPANQVWAGVPARLIKHRGGALPSRKQSLCTVLNPS